MSRQHAASLSLGVISGAIAGLAAVTPAAGYVNVAGAMLIGFTVLQLQRLSRMEFRTARGVDR